VTSSGKGSLYNNRISTPAKEVEKIPVQKNLFEEEEKRFPIEEKNTKAEEIGIFSTSLAGVEIRLLYREPLPEINQFKFTSGKACAILSNTSNPEDLTIPINHGLIVLLHL